MDALLKEAAKDQDWNKIAASHLQQLAFFQHERLMHLIVTMTVAILTLISMGITLLSTNLGTMLLTVLLLVLLLPYLYHYYLLENGVQKMYTQYDLIQQKLVEKDEDDPEKINSIK
jgi:Ca2+/Na+ antiporter